MEVKKQYKVIIQAEYIGTVEATTEEEAEDVSLDDFDPDGFWREIDRQVVQVREVKS